MTAAAPELRAPRRVARADALSQPSDMQSYAMPVAVPLSRRLPFSTLVASAAFAALMTGVAVNALFLQSERHPAPLFARIAAAEATPTQELRELAATRTPLEADRPVARVAAPTPPARPTVSVVEPTPAPAARPTAPHATPPEARKPEARKPEAPRAEASRKPDGVAALLRGDSVGSISPTPRLASAQRALAKLGFEVKPDGVAGPATRQAIEAFERRQGLPVTGELNSRTLRKLAIASGVSIE